MSLKSQEFGLSWFSLAWKGWTCLRGRHSRNKTYQQICIIICKTNCKAKGVCVFCFFLNVQSTVQKYSVHRLQWGRKERRDQFKKIKLNAKTPKCKMAKDSLIVWFKVCALGSAEGNVTLKESILKGYCQVCTNCHWYRCSFLIKLWKLSPLLYCICSWSLWPTFTDSKQQR